MTTSVVPISCLSACIVSLLWTRVATGLLKGAGHAVLGTLYSRADRIGLDGTSCSSDGLCKNLSSGFFVVVVVCVMVCPASEVVVLAEEQLQGFGDHVRRRSIDELSIELQLRLYRFLDTGLDSDGFWLFRWCFQNGQLASPFFFVQNVRHVV